MNVRFKAGLTGKFDFQDGDRITVIVNDTTSYHGVLTELREEEGFRCVLDNDKVKEEYFAFLDVERVIEG